MVTFIVQDGEILRLQWRG